MALCMKLLVDNQSKRVPFAEASKETVDFLFHILSLPVATVITLLRGQGMVGSLANLYQSVEKLNESYIQPNQSKENLLKPRPPVAISSVPLLQMDNETIHRKYYACTNISYCSNRVSDNPSAICPQCNRTMIKVVPYVAPPQVIKQASAEGGFVKGVVTYMITDTLVVKPMSTISSVTLLKSYNIKDVLSLQEKEVTLGMDEAVKLLKASLQSEKVLTDVFMV